MVKEIYYFGSFNPFHEGHKMVALCVSSHFYNCKVHITPSPCSPFKKKKDMLPIEDRIEIIKSMLGGCGILDLSMLDVSTIDAEVGNGKEQHYSYETLEVIKSQYKGDSKEIGFLVGSDTLAMFDKWKNWEWIMDNFTVIVYPRIGDNIDELLFRYPQAILGTPYYNQGNMEFPPQFGNSQRTEISDELFEKLKKEGIYERATETVCASPLPYIYFEYSSTQIREMLKNFDENYKVLNTMYSDKTLKILEHLYKNKNEHEQ